MKRLLTYIALALLMPMMAQAQSSLYEHHFNLKEVKLLDGPMKTALERNNQLLLQYDADRLLSPFVRQAGLNTGRYAGWLQAHPIFKNWGGDAGFDLNGHVGGHYVSALALAYAATDEGSVRQQLKERMQYVLDVLNDCQKAYDNDQEGMYGFLGGQPINDSWRAMARGDLSKIRSNWGWVPFYCQHKVLAGLRDAYLYGESELAKEMFRKMADWTVNLIAKVSDSDLQGFLDCEHGGINESLVDAYQLFGDAKYLTAAKRFSHRTMLNGMQKLDTSFLDNRHANTQVPKYIGFERVGEQDATATNYLRAAENFWQDVAENRTVCIGGNSVSEHFLPKANAQRYINVPDGPESCNSNNMLKLSELLATRTHDARYADFYEHTMWNHILSTQDPLTGGYVYFTTLRPQAYRIYSTVNESMWCCVGTGMENHSKYGHFIYTHDGDDVLYVNLFTASELSNEHFGLRQETRFPYVDPQVSALPTPQTSVSYMTVTRGGKYQIAVRHPAWAGKEFQITVNGKQVEQDVVQGTASYVVIDRKWKVGDKINVYLPMEITMEECPGYGDYVAFHCGPILLAAQTTASSEAEAAATGLKYEALPNVYGHEGRMDHAPGNMATIKSLISAPLLIGERSDVLSRITPKEPWNLVFNIDVSRPDAPTYTWKTLQLRPFYDIHHARYQCYWYQQTPENFANSDMAQTEAANEALLQRTLDFVAPGEQQSEAGHEVRYSNGSTTGTYNSERYRDAQAGGFVQYTLFNKEGITEKLSILCRFTTSDRGRKATLTVDGQKIADIEIPARMKGGDGSGFYNIEFPLPEEIMTNNGKAKEKFVVRLSATSNTPNPGLYYLRLMRDYDPHAYHFVATDWVTGDPGRVAQNRISYDTDANTITVPQTGSNNVCLMLDHEKTDYTIAKSQKYLVVKGQNLLTSSGSSYLWWLNGVNKGSQVLPTVAKTASVDGESYQVIAWDMTKSQLDANITGDRPNVTIGQTIFGLTWNGKSSAGSTVRGAVISDIDFGENADDVLSAIESTSCNRHRSGSQAIYDLQGREIRQPRQGVYIVGNHKLIAR